MANICHVLFAYIEITGRYPHSAGQVRISKGVDYTRSLFSEPGELLNNKIVIGKKLRSAAGVLGVLLGTSFLDGCTELMLSMRESYQQQPSYGVDTSPGFIYLPDMGFSVVSDGASNVIFYDNLYYVYDNGYWYRSQQNRAPWVIVREEVLPPKIRRHRWEDIKRYRDNEYRKHNPERGDERGQHPASRPPLRPEQRAERPPAVRQEQRVERFPEIRPEQRAGHPPVQRQEQRVEAPQPVRPEQRAESRPPIKPDQRGEVKPPARQNEKNEKKREDDRVESERNQEQIRPGR